MNKQPQEQLKTPPLEEGGISTNAKRCHHLRVPVFPHERHIIEESAKRAGKSVAGYLREVGQGYRIQGVVDADHVRKLAEIDGNIGKWVKVLKLWLDNDERTAKLGDSHILGLLAKIDALQTEMGNVMMRVVSPKSDNLPDEGF